MFTVEQRKFIVKRYYELDKDLAALHWEFQAKFFIVAPARRSILKMVAKFESKGTVHNLHKGNSGRLVTVSSEANIERVRDHFATNPRTSIKAASQNLNISKTSVQLMLKKKLKMHPYKMQPVQLLTPRARTNRVNCAHMLLELLNNEQQEDVLNNIWFSDEAHFYLSGYCNKQNQRHWALENPHELLESPLFPKRITMWCAFSSKGIHSVVVRENVNSERYLNLLQNQFLPYLEETNELDNAYFMQDGARPHTAHIVLDFLEEIFDERVISNLYPERYRKGFSWPAYSPDLNPCDFFLWGYLKDRVYVGNPTTLQQLEEAILTEIARIPPDFLLNTVQAFPKRLQLVIDNNGGHVEPLL